jgi:methyl-accepting chemotaxis protein
MENTSAVLVNSQIQEISATSEQISAATEQVAASKFILWMEPPLIHF